MKTVCARLCLSLLITTVLMVGSGGVVANEGSVFSSSDVRVIEDILGDPNTTGLGYFEEFDAIRLEVERISSPAHDENRE